MYGKPRKYQPQIDVCDNLISFLDSLKPKTDIVEEEDITYISEDVQAKLASGDWKKEKVHILKKEEEDLGIQPGQGKKKGKNKKKKHAEKEVEDTKLALTMQTLECFDQIKVSPPNFFKEIEASLKELNEKKAYFIKVSDDLNDGKQVDGDDNKLEEPKEEQSEQAAPKKAKKEKVNLDDDEMFPAMGM